MADANQDDTLVFGNNNQNTNTAPQQPSGQRLTVQDLYGPSTDQPAPPSPAQQPPAQPIQEVPPLEQSAFQTPQTPPVSEAPLNPNQQQPAEIVVDQTQQQSQVPSDIWQSLEQTPDQSVQGGEEILQPPTQPLPAPEQTASLQPAESPPPPPEGTVPPPPPPPQPFPPGINPLRSKMKFIIGGVAGLILILLIAVFVFSRIGGGGSGEATLNYWGLWEENKTMQVIIDDFEKKYPTIDVVYKKQDLKKYKDRIVTRLSSETGTDDLPDIFTYNNAWLPTLTNVLAPLPNTVITPDDFKKTYYPVIQNDLTFNGAIYGIPQGIDTLNVFVNREMFEAAGLQIPQTWDEFIRAAKILTVKEQNGKIKTAGAALGTYDNIKHAPDIASLLMLQNGADLSNLSNSQGNIADALVFYTSFAKDSEYVWDGSMSPSLLAFANGDVAMMFGYSWDIFAIKAANPKLVFDIHPVPNLPNKKITVASYWVNGVSNKTKHQKEAMLFMQYLSQKEVVQKLYTESSKTRLFGMPFARTDLAKTLEDNPLVYPFVQSADYASSTYFVSDTKDTNYIERLNAYLANAVRAVLSGGSADSAAQTLIQGVAQVRSEFGL